MSEEEKEAIAYLNKYIKIDLIYEQKHYNKIEIVLNLINKLQKENEELKTHFSPEVLHELLKESEEN